MADDANRDVSDESGNRSLWDRGFTIVPNIMLNDRELRPADYMCYLAIRRRANRDGECWPGLRRIAAEAKVSKTAVRGSVQKLERNGYITRERRFVEGTKAAERTLYHIAGLGHSVPHVGQNMTGGGELSDPGVGQNMTPNNKHITRTKEQEREAHAPHELEHEFETWWDTYPQKRDQGKALDEYKIARKAYSPEQLLAARDNYVADCARTETLLKYGKTFLNRPYIEYIDGPPEDAADFDQDEAAFAETAKGLAGRD